MHEFERIFESACVREIQIKCEKQIELFWEGWMLFLIFLSFSSSFLVAHCMQCRDGVDRKCSFKRMNLN